MVLAIKQWKTQNVSITPNIVTSYTPTTDANVLYIINRVSSGGGNIYADDQTNPNVSTVRYALNVNQGTTGAVVRPYKQNIFYLTTDAATTVTIQVIEIVSEDLSFVFNSSQLVQVAGTVNVAGSVEISNDIGNPIPVSGNVNNNNYMQDPVGLLWYSFKTASTADAVAATNVLATGLYGSNGSGAFRPLTINPSNNNALKIETTNYVTNTILTTGTPTLATYITPVATNGAKSMLVRLSSIAGGTVEFYIYGLTKNVNSLSTRDQLTGWVNGKITTTFNETNLYQSIFFDISNYQYITMYMLGTSTATSVQIESNFSANNGFDITNPQTPTASADGLDVAGQYVPFNKTLLSALNTSTNKFDSLRTVSVGDAYGGNGLLANGMYGFNGTNYDRLKTAYGTGDGVNGQGILANGLYGFNGTSWDRVMTSNSGQLRVSLFSTTGIAAAVASGGYGDTQSPPNMFASGAFNLGYNGTSWDRLRTVNTGQLVTTIKSSTGIEAAVYNISTGYTDGSALGVGGFATISAGFAWNGSSFDRIRTAAGLGATTTTLTGAAASVMYGWNGTGAQVERIKTVADGLTGTTNGILKVSLYDSGGNHYNNQNLGAIGDGQTFTAQNFGNVTGSVGYGYIGSGTFDRVRISKVYKGIEYLTLASGSAATVWTPTTNKSFRLMGVSISASVAGKYSIRDGATNIILYFNVAANDSVTFYLGNGLLSTAANNVMYVVNGTGSTANVWCNAWGVEE